MLKLSKIDGKLHMALWTDESFEAMGNVEQRSRKEAELSKWDREDSDGADGADDVDDDDDDVEAAAMVGEGLEEPSAEEFETTNAEMDGAPGVASAGACI